MKKTFILENLDCANCATKIENHVKKIEGVKDIVINFFTAKASVEIEEENEIIMEKIIKVIGKIDRKIKVKII